MNPETKECWAVVESDTDLSETQVENEISGRTGIAGAGLEGTDAANMDMESEVLATAQQLIRAEVRRHPIPLNTSLIVPPRNWDLIQPRVLGPRLTGRSRPRPRGWGGAPRHLGKDCAGYWMNQIPRAKLRRRDLSALLFRQPPPLPILHPTTPPPHRNQWIIPEITFPVTILPMFQRRRTPVQGSHLVTKVRAEWFTRTMRANTIVPEKTLDEVPPHDHRSHGE